MIFDHNVPSQRCAVRENDVVSDPAIMGDMRLGHKQVPRANLGKAPALLGASMQRCKLPKGVSVPGKQPASFASILEVRRILARRHERKKDAFAPELGWAIYHAMTGHSHVVVEYNVIADNRVRTDDAIAAYFSFGADYRCRVD
jgi:hypothetical protein